MSKWKYGLKLEPCGACGQFDKLDAEARSVYSRLLTLFEGHPDEDFNLYRLDAGAELSKAGMIPYNCFNCNDFGERWRTVTGKYFKMGELPDRIDGQVDNIEVAGV